MIANNKIVYECRKVRRVRRNPGIRAAAFKGDDGCMHTYLNAGLPVDAEGVLIAPITASVCVTCGHGYSELMHTDANVCSECRLQETAHRALRLERAGIPMGFGWHEPQSDLVEQAGYTDIAPSRIHRRTDAHRYACLKK